MPVVNRQKKIAEKDLYSLRPRECDKKPEGQGSDPDRNMFQNS